MTATPLICHVCKQELVKPVDWLPAELLKRMHEGDIKVVDDIQMHYSASIVDTNLEHFARKHPRTVAKYDEWKKHIQ